MRRPKKGNSYIPLPREDELPTVEESILTREVLGTPSTTKTKRELKSGDILLLPTVEEGLEPPSTTGGEEVQTTTMPKRKMNVLPLPTVEETVEPSTMVGEETQPTTKPKKATKPKRKLKTGNRYILPLPPLEELLEPSSTTSPEEGHTTTRLVPPIEEFPNLAELLEPPTTTFGDEAHNPTPSPALPSLTPYSTQLLASAATNLLTPPGQPSPTPSPPHYLFRYWCNICNTQIFTPSIVEAHLRRHRDPITGEWTCTTCGKKYLNGRWGYGLLIRHMQGRGGLACSGITDLREQWKALVEAEGNADMREALG